MTRLEKAPLIEAIFELRWGRSPDLNQPIQLSRQETEESNLFPGLFMAELKNLGFVVHENANPQVPDTITFPQLVRHRFRKAEGTWPCYQIGSGIFTTNQVNDGYNWKKFKADVLSGLGVLDKSHPQHLSGLSNVGIDLRYQDGFLFEEGESPLSFLTNKMEVGFKLPSNFLDNSLLDADSAPQCMLAFNLGLTTPKARAVCTLAPGLINGRPGFVLDTVVQSQGESAPPMTTADLGNWLDQAHAVHQHAFRTLINPTFARTFK